MDKDIVVYIPKELHRSVKHNVFTSEGMEEINGKVLVWLEEQNKDIGICLKINEGITWIK